MISLQPAESVIGGLQGFSLFSNGDSFAARRSRRALRDPPAPNVNPFVISAGRKCTFHGEDFYSSHASTYTWRVFRLQRTKELARERERDLGSVTKGSSTMKGIRLTSILKHRKKRAGTDSVILSKVNIYVSVSCFRRHSFV